MPRGLSKIREISEEAAARRRAFEEGGPGLRFLSLKDGDTELVRFLEQGDEVWYVWTHKLPKQPGQKFGDDVLCLDQEDAGVACPACERGKTRSSKVCINVIWFNAPKLRMTDDGKKVWKDESGNIQIIGKEDTLAVWTTGPTNGGRLEYLDTEHGGLTSCIFKIHRQGAGKDDTKYFIDIHEPNKTPTPAEAELYKGKPDPRKAIKQLGYGDLARAYSGGGTAATVEPGSQPQPGASLENNIFAKAAAGAGQGGTGTGGAPNPSAFGS
jgi:hypothetical protein